VLVLLDSLVGYLEQGMGTSEGLILQGTKQYRKTVTYIHTCLKRNSNPYSRCSSCPRP